MKVEIVAKQVAERRRRFADSLCTSLKLSSAQREPLSNVLALTNGSQFDIYLCYPCRFSEAFPSVANDVLLELSWCGRVALDHILLYDYLLDTEHPVNPSILLGSYAFQREWICSLQTLFLSDSSFWEYLAQYETETTRTLLEERLKWQQAPTSFTLVDARRQAIGKTALSRLAVVGLACLTGQEDSEKMHGLIRSINHYNFARQIIDDLLDWRRDYTNRRISYLLASAMMKLDGFDYDDGSSVSKVGSVIYTQVAPSALDLAKQELDKALKLARTYGPCPQWQQAVKSLVAIIRKQQETIVKVTENSRCDTVQATRAANPQDSKTVVAIKAARTFLLSGQDSAGCWRDFATSAGESEDWVTGYVGWALCSTGQLPSDALQRAVSWLQKSQFPEGGWGYRRSVVVDADSTAWCLRFMAHAGSRQQELEGALRILLDHQHADGGFSTYDHPDDIRACMQLEETKSFSGWCEPQVCVTAATTAALLDCGFDVTIYPVAKAVDYLMAHQQPKGYWLSYWWGGPQYATAYALQAMNRSGGMNARVVGLACRWLLKSQLADGGWSQAPGQPSTPFCTALVIQGLLAQRAPDSSVLDAARRGVAWLVKNQAQDGSWRSSAMLLVPHPDEEEPWKIEKWPMAMHGTGIARRDHRRLFTTATVFVALNKATETGLNL